MAEFRQIAFMSGKGGVGKTSLLVAFSRRLQGRVSILDLDFSNPVAHIALGLNHHTHGTLKGYRIAPVAWEKGEVGSLAFFTVPGGIIRHSAEHRAQFLEDFISNLAWQPYDWLLIDTAPALTQENEVILKMLDPEVVLVGEPGPLALEWVIRTPLFLECVKAKVLGLVGNKGLDAGGLAEDLGLADLGTVPLAPDPSQVAVPDFTRFKGRRLGEAGLALKAKRWLAREGLAAVLEVE